MRKYKDSYNLSNLNLETLICITEKFKTCENELEHIEDTIRESIITNLLGELTHNDERSISDFYVGVNVIEFTLNETSVLYSILRYLEKNKWIISKYKLDKYWIIYIDNLKKDIACKFIEEVIR
ncbi:MAG: hypothetical protein RR835_10350 [Peptostreptococcaceae bacterium]